MPNCIGWTEAFQQNMDALNVPAPASLFDSYERAVATLGNIIAASSISPSASAYAGVVTGSVMVATSKQLGCAMKSRIMPVTVSAFLIENGIYDGGWVYAEMSKNPQLMAMAA